MPTMNNAHAVLIGIADYQHIRSLPASVLKDAEDVYGVLADPQLCRVCG